MNEHDTFDDWPELEQLREVHRDDRMPSDVRERVLSRAGLPRAFPERPLVGLADAVASSSIEAEPSAWDESRGRAHAPARRRSRRTWLFAAGAVLPMAAALALWLRIPADRIEVESEHPAPLELAARPHSAEELRALGVEPGTSEVRVVGRLVSGSLSRLPPLPPHQRIRCGYHFHLRQSGETSGDGLHVEYARCRAPEALIDDGATCVEVTAVGVMRSDGHLDATGLTPKIITPCSPLH